MKKIKYTRTTLTKELFEFEDSDIPVFNTLFKDYITDNTDSDLVDSLKSFTKEQKSPSPNTDELKLLPRAIKLSDNHRIQVNELSRPDFTSDNNGKFDEAVAYVKTEWESIKYCIANGRPLYMIGAVQLGKTIIYNAIAYLALKGFTKDDGTVEQPLVELAIITTNNLTSSGDQNRKRSKLYLQNTTNKITVHDIRLMKDDTVMPGSVIQSLTNTSQLDKVRSLIERSSQEDKDHHDMIGSGFKPWKVLVLHDEADQANSNIADNESAQKKNKSHSITEKELNDLLDIDPLLANVCYAGISATIFSQLAIYGTFGAHRYGDLLTEQIISVPVPSEYKGFVTKDSNGYITYNPNFAKAGLLYEDTQYFKSGKYVSGVKAGDGKAKNPKFIAVKMLDHYNINNPYQLTQIATVNLTKDTKGHYRTAELITGELNLLVSGIAQFINESNSAIDVKNEYVVITHNGDPDAGSAGFSAEEKIEKIYESAYQNGINLKGIVIVGGWLVSRAISFGTKKYDFAYCNLSFTLPSLTVDREALIQSARCSGCYPDVKEHVFYTVDTCIEAIENYINIVYSDFLPALRKNGKITKSDLVSDYVSKAVITTAGNQTKTVKFSTGISRHDTYNGANSGSTTKATTTNWKDLTQYTRDNYIQTGIVQSGIIKQVIPADYAISLTQTEYNQLIDITTKNDNLAIKKFLEQHRILNIPNKLRHNNDRKNESLNGTKRLTPNELRNLFYAGVGVTVWQASNGSYWLYYWAGQPSGGSQYSVSYNLEIDTNGKVYHLDRIDQLSNIEQPAIKPTINGVVRSILTLPN